MWAPKTTRWLTAAIFGLYRFFKQTGWLPVGCCRFWPSCSAYAQQAIELNGFLRGIGMTGKRLLRCWPGHAGGIDPPKNYNYMKINKL